MLFVQSLLATSSMLCIVVTAQSKNLLFTDVPTFVQAGHAYRISYKASDMSVPASIILRKGNPNNRQAVQTLAPQAINGIFDWTPSESLSDGEDYALEIQQGTEINSSPSIRLSGGARPAPYVPIPYGSPSSQPVYGITSSKLVYSYPMSSMELSTYAYSSSTCSYSTLSTSVYTSQSASYTQSSNISQASYPGYSSSHELPTLSSTCVSTGSASNYTAPSKSAPPITGSATASYTGPPTPNAGMTILQKSGGPFALVAGAVLAAILG